MKLAGETTQISGSEIKEANDQGKSVRLLRLRSGWRWSTHMRDRYMFGDASCRPISGTIVCTTGSLFILGADGVVENYNAGDIFVVGQSMVDCWVPAAATGMTTTLVETI